MKIGNLSKVGMAFGLILLILTEVRYFVLNQDIDKALFFGITCGLIILFSWMWNLLIDTRRVQDQMEIYLSDLNNEGGK